MRVCEEVPEGGRIVTAILLFISTFGLVFFLGLQSLNVNGGHYLAAFFTSFGIGIGNMVLYKLAPNANSLEILAYLMGGPFGIIASMAAHRRFIRRKEAPAVNAGNVETQGSSPKPHIHIGTCGGGYWVCSRGLVCGTGASIKDAYAALSRKLRIRGQTRRGC